ncbi:glutaminase [Marinicella sp. S1101]|uniref:glutaminase n=1 Tax=Marinicella marina TaxID=2996016 RepID=UPI002260CE1C|nr:glutaminase [Marinicella marina]MCX7554977.1 glutaminase [Marinicella marina]MDJ1141587.1 glutaminase [Marinicella marina]
MNYQQIIERIHQEVLLHKNYGEVADYIPELAGIDDDQFGVCLAHVDGKIYRTGDWQTHFSLQSIVKVLLLSLAYARLGGQLWQRVGVEPSGTPFNSLGTLEHDDGIPRNPFSNAGALVVSDVLLDLYQDPKAALLDLIHSFSGDEGIQFDRNVAESEKAEGYRNVALVNFLKSLGNIHNDVDDVLALYFDCCSVAINCEQLAKTFLFFANNGQTIDDHHRLLNRSQTKRINAIMLTCGFYDEAGDFAYQVGLPGKSGVGGGIVAVLPKEFSIAVWSPRLNEKGNSYRGLKFLEQFTTETGQSIF